MIHDAVLEFDYADTDSAALVARSVSVEAGDIDGDRTGVTIDRDGPTVRITVRASDLVALRAGLNTWSSLVAVAEESGGVARASDGVAPSDA